MVSQGWRCPANRVDVSRARSRTPGFQQQQVAYSRTSRASQHHERDCKAASRCEKLAFSLADGLATSWQRQELERVYCQEAGCLVHNLESSLHFSAESGATSAEPPLERPRAIIASSPDDVASTDTYKVQLNEPPKKERMKPDDDFYANVGDAIRTLREDVPVLFKRDLNYDIYREDVTFRDPRNCFRGMDNYKLIFWSLRFHGKLFFKELYVEVKRIWQKSDDTICLRWTVHGFPRLPWDQEGLFDGISTYRLDSHGKIYEHKVDNVMLSDPPMQRLPLLIKVNLAPVQQPYPSPWLDLPEANACSDAQGNASFEC